MPSKGDIKLKSQTLAAWLKKNGVERSTGMCPWDCGRSVPNGGQALLAHLTHCTGATRKDKRKK